MLERYSTVRHKWSLRVYNVSYIAKGDFLLIFLMTALPVTSEGLLHLPFQFTSGLSKVGAHVLKLRSRDTTVENIAENQINAPLVVRRQHEPYHKRCEPLK